MLETFSLPILVKAIDFLFGECSKILQERRERRQKEAAPATIPAQTAQPPAPADPAPPQPAIQTRALALETPVPQPVWLEAQSQVEHLTSLLEIHLRNYQLVSKQAALWGEALMPPIIANNLRHEEQEIAKLTGELQRLLSKVYAQKVAAVPEDQFYE